MRKLFHILKEELKNGRKCVLVTVIGSSGSTPREAGAHMLITAKGRLYGTIGGGAVEFHCEQKAQKVLKTKKSQMKYYCLDKNLVQDLGMICGGKILVYFRYVTAYDAAFLALAEKIESIYQRTEPSWLISEISSKQDGAMGVYGKQSGLFGMDVPGEVLEQLGSKPAQIEYEGQIFYYEMLVQAGVVYIFGGGHVARALVPVLSKVKFRCWVLEDREAFCRPELFAGAEITRLIDNNRIDEHIVIGEDDYVVIMTRGHKDDQKILEQVLKTPARYIGVIGSRQKSKTVYNNLCEMGFTKQELRRVTSPIGLKIKAQTPEEIAVSITAQLILERARRDT